jgi:prepilin-type N-terminal cleavage/methylation domain-containing protein
MQIRQQRALARAAFTLTEMMVVVTIIVLLAGLGGGIAWKVYEDAQDNAAQAKCYTIKKAAEAWRLHNDSEDAPSVEQLLNGDGDGSKPYLEKEDVKTPWANGRFDISTGEHNTIVVTTSHGTKVISTKKDH